MKMLYETELQDADTPSEMRAALYKAGWSEPLVRRTYDRAWVEGLSGEDTHTLLAYAAIKSLIKLRGDYSHYMNINPIERIVPDPDSPKGE